MVDRTSFLSPFIDTAIQTPLSESSVMFSSVQFGLVQDVTYALEKAHN